MSVKVKNADGTWSQVGGMQKPGFQDISGSPNDNTNLKNALDAKQAEIMNNVPGSGGQFLRRKADNTGLEFVTGGASGVADVQVSDDGATYTTIVDGSGVAKLDRSAEVTHIADTVKHVTTADKTAWNAKSKVEVSATGTATDEVQYIKIDGVEKKIAGGDVSGKLDKLPKPTYPGAGGHYNFPYNAEFTADGSKIDIQIETMSLDGDEAQQSFTKTVPAATTTTAGLMTAADKVSLGEKSKVSVSATGTATDEVQYITVDGIEKKLAGGGGGTITDVQVDGTSVVTAGVANIVGKADEADLTAHTGDTSVHVTTAEKASWTGKYTKPTNGIPSMDMTEAVRASLQKADASATQADFLVHTGDTDIHVTASDKDNWDAKYEKPSTGIPKTDLASTVQTSLGKADSAVQSVTTGDTNGTVKVDGTNVAVNGLGSAAFTSSSNYATSTDFDLHVANTGVHTTTADKLVWFAKYDKPTTGIPEEDLSSDVTDLLDKADTAVQSVTTGGANGTIKVDGTDVSVKGLGTAAYKADTYFVAAEANKRLMTNDEGTKLEYIEDNAQENVIENVSVNGVPLLVVGSKSVDIVIEESTHMGKIRVNEDDIPIYGLGSAAYTDSGWYATTAQGLKADTAVQSVATGATNGTIKVDGTDVAVKGLGSAAYEDVSQFANNASFEAHKSNTLNPHNVTKEQVGLSHVENKNGATIRSEMTAGEVISALAYTPADNSKVGIANGIAQLGSDGKVPSSQLPAYVDSIIEVDSYGDLPTTGAGNKIYITKDTNKTYRWSGSSYVEISASLALGETSSTAYAGDKGKIAFDHSQIAGGTGVHVSDAERTAWTAKQNALTTAQISAVDSGVTATKVSGYDTHVADTNIHVTATKKAGWDAKYEKPSTGIPKADLVSTVQSSLDKADAAVSTSTFNTHTSNVTVHVNTSDRSNWNAKADNTALVAHTSNSTVHVTAANKSAWNAKYDKPSIGIPKSDLVSAVQTSLGKADTALQSHQTIATGSANGTISVAGSDVAVKGLSTAAYTSSTAYATSAQGTKADSAYQRPSTGIPKTDLATDVQTSLGKADTAVQDVSGKENTSNKTDDVLTNKLSTTKYTSAKGVFTATAKYASTVLENGSWNSSSKTQSVTISGIDVTKELVWPVVSTDSTVLYQECGVRLSGSSGSNTLTFTCESIPTSDLVIYIAIIPITITSSAAGAF